MHKLLWRLTFIFFLTIGGSFALLHFYKADLLVYFLKKNMDADTIVMNKVTGFFPFETHIESLECLKSHNTILSAKNINIHFNPAALIFGFFSFDLIAMDDLVIKHDPLCEKDTDSSSDYTALPALIIKVLNIKGIFKNAPFMITGSMENKDYTLTLVHDHHPITIKGSLDFWTVSGSLETTLPTINHYAHCANFLPPALNLGQGHVNCSFKGALGHPLDEWSFSGKIMGSDVLDIKHATLLTTLSYNEKKLHITGTSLLNGIKKDFVMDKNDVSPLSFSASSFLTPTSKPIQTTGTLSFSDHAVDVTAHFTDSFINAPLNLHIDYAKGILFDLNMGEIGKLHGIYDNKTLSIDTFNLALPSLHLALKRPFVIDVTSSHITPASFTLNNGSVNFSEIFFKDKLKGSITLSDFSCPDLLPLKINAKGSLSGFIHQPRFDYDIKAQHKNIPFCIAGKALFKENLDIDASFKSTLNLETLKILIDPHDTLHGSAFIHGSIKGSFLNPTIKADVNFKNFAYSNYISGTTVTKIEGGLALDQNIITLDLMAYDDFTGTVMIKEKYDLLTIDQPIPLVFNNFYLGQSDLFTGRGSGTLLLNLANKTLTGDMLLHEVSVDLDQLSPSGMPRLRKIKTKKSVKHEPTTPPLFNINIMLKPEKALILNGFGIQSTWDGFLNVKTPEGFLGEFHLVKGEIDLASKKFDFTRGHIRFDGNIKKPILDVDVMKKIKEYKVKVALIGRPLDPKISFLSEPSLTQEEVLSLILFGQKTASGSLGQLFDVGSTLTTLHRQGGDTFFTSFRKIFGIDNLEFKKTDHPSDDGQDEQHTLNIRKQLTPDVSIEFEQSLGRTETNQSKASLVGNITDELSAQVDVGSNKSGAFGLMWTKRY